MSKKEKAEFNANYNGEAIKPGEVMVPFELTKYDKENCRNPECIRTISQGGHYFRVIYKAVPEEWAKEAKAAFNLTQNEQLGHYSVPNSVSLDKLQEDEWDGKGKEQRSFVASPIETKVETLAMFERLMKELIEKSPKLGYAVLLVQSDVKGEEFYCRMKLSRTPANLVLQQAKVILSNGLANLNKSDFRINKSRLDEEYRSGAYKLLNELIKMVG